MNTRNVTIGICATVVGVMAGSVAIGFTQDLSLEGSAVAYRSSLVKPGIESRIRHLKVVPLKRSSSSSSSSMSEDASSSSSAPSMTACDGARAALNDMAKVIVRVVPQKSSNNAILETLAAARLEITDRYCSDEAVMTAPASSSSSSSVASMHPAPVECDGLQFGTVRYIQCVLEHTAN